METGLVRSFDAWISRVVDWLSADPLRGQGKVKVPAPPPPPPPVEARRTKKAVKRPPAKPAAKKPAAKKATAKKPAAKKPAAKKAKSPAPRKSAVRGVVEEKILTALAALGGDAAMKELVAETGETRSALSATLKKLASAGHVRRVGAGLKTRYERTED